MKKSLLGKINVKKKHMTTKKTGAKKAVAKKKPSLVTAKIAAIGTGVAALGAATYYFFGPKGKKHQKDAKAWMRGMKDDVSKKIAKAEELTESAYHKIVDEASKVYAHNGKAEVEKFAKTLKSEWKHLAKSTAKPVRRAVKKVSKVAKSVKKAVKK